MPVLPGTRLAQIQWLETRLPQWATAAAAIGLTAEQVAEMQTLTTDARAAYDTAQAARAATKNTTQAFHAASDAMRTRAGELINQIKAFAATTGDPNVYTEASVPPPASPSPAPAPAMPDNLTTTLLNDGSILLKWTATQPAPGAEVYFTVQRKLAGQAIFVNIGDTGEKKFIDASLPQGTPSATYQLIAKRGNHASEPSEAVTIFLGVPQADGGETELKIAA